MRTVARDIGHMLSRAGVRYAFGHPGGEVVELIEGLRAEGIEFVLTRHEATAAFMADATGHYTGIPGVCVATLGPGATNLVTGVAHAHLDRAPVLAMTGQLASSRYDVVTHQKLDLGAIFAPITKWHAQIRPENVRAVLGRAIRVAGRHRPGPVHLELASDVAGQETRDSRVVETGTIATATQFRAADAVEAAKALRASKRPLIMAGLDASNRQVVEPLRTLAEDWSIPVMVSPKGKGVFREDHQLFLGTIEMLGTSRLFDLVDTCDLVVMVGMEPVEFDRDWTAGASIVHVGPQPNDDLYFSSDVELVGPVDVALESLRSSLGSPRPTWDTSEVRSIRENFLAYVNPSVDGLSAQDVLRELRVALPDDAIVTCDVGQNKSVTGQCWPTFEPRTFFMSNGLSSMGYGLPAAMALKLLNPDRAVACILGDGGLGMYMGEIETAVRRGLAITIVVLADDALSQIKLNQVRRGYAPTGTELGPVDYVGLARAMGADGRAVSHAGECRDAFTWALSRSSGPTVISAAINAACYVL